MRQLNIYNGPTYSVPNDKDCVFCKHCHFLWDYTNGPYAFFCDLLRPEADEVATPEDHTCEMFCENNETQGYHIDIQE